MVLWPFDAKAAGLWAVIRDAGTMVMFAGTPWAHLHICGSPWDGMAKTLLSTSDRSLSEVALEAGFSDQAAFSRTFKALVGASPGQWKREAVHRPGGFQNTVFAA
jgi:Helix-turn-helix domain